MAESEGFPSRTIDPTSVPCSPLGSVDSAAHAQHAATFWRRQWIPQADLPQSVLAHEIDVWLAEKLRAGAPYDRIVRDLLTAGRTKAQEKAPTTFLAGGEYKPENLAANTTAVASRHQPRKGPVPQPPFARWTRNQFWETAAFFTRPTPAGALPARFELTIPNTKTTVGPRLLTDPQPAWPEALDGDSARSILASWVTATENPYFARNAVNRIWAGLLIGLRLWSNRSTTWSGENLFGQRPELLDDLRQGVRRKLIRLKHITTSIVLDASLTALLELGTADDDSHAQLFARAPVRALTGEQLYDSLRTAAGLPVERGELDPPNLPRERREFAEKYRIDRAATAQRSILQALSLMNGPLTTTFTSVATSPALAAIAHAPFLSTTEKIESLFLAALWPWADRT